MIPHASAGIKTFHIIIIHNALCVELYFWFIFVNTLSDFFLILFFEIEIKNKLHLTLLMPHFI